MSDNQWLVVVALVLVTCLGVSLYRPKISAVESCAGELNTGLTVRQKGALYGIASLTLTGVIGTL